MQVQLLSSYLPKTNRTKRENPQLSLIQKGLTNTCEKKLTELNWSVFSGRSGLDGVPGPVGTVGICLEGAPGPKGEEGQMGVIGFTGTNCAVCSEGSVPLNSRTSL